MRIRVPQPSLNDKQLATLHARFVVPIAVQMILNDTEQLDEECECALHECLSELAPDTGLLCLALCTQHAGDDIVDVVAPDYYNDYQDAANGSVAGWNDESDEYDALGNPQGPEAWRRWAASHGKPLAFPELGLKPAGMGGGDRPEWIKALNAWMTKHANTATWQIGEDIPKAAAGKVLYFAYFNVVHGGDAGFTIFGHGANQDSAPVYRSLKWGNNAAG